MLRMVFLRTMFLPLGSLILVLLLATTTSTVSATTDEEQNNISSSYNCFTSTEHLYAAVDAVLWNRQRTAISPHYTPLSAFTAVTAVYGPRMSQWCFAPELTSLARVFSVSNAIRSWRTTGGMVVFLMVKPTTGAGGMCNTCKILVFSLKACAFSRDGAWSTGPCVKL